MRDFDVTRAAHAARDRSFKIAGEEFVVVASARPEVIDPVSQVAPTDPAYLETLDDAIGQLLEGDGGRRWAALRARTSHDPLSLADVNDVFSFCMEAVTGRPPTQRSSSSPSPATPALGTFSTVGSSEPAAAEPEPSTPGS